MVRHVQSNSSRKKVGGASNDSEAKPAPTVKKKKTSKEKATTEAHGGNNAGPSKPPTVDRKGPPKKGKNRYRPAPPFTLCAIRSVGGGGLQRPSPQSIPEIRRSQRSSALLAPQLPFQRLTRETAQGLSATGFSFQGDAIAAVQNAAEHYLAGVFEDASLCATHAKRRTTNEKDLLLALRLRGDLDAPNLNPGHYRNLL